MFLFRNIRFYDKGFAMTFNKKTLSATLLSAGLLASTSSFAQDERTTTPPAEVISMIVDGTKTAATVVADASVKTYEFVKPYAGAAWDTTKEVSVVAAQKTKEAAIKSKDYISQKINENREPQQPTYIPIESYSLSGAQQNSQSQQNYNQPQYNYSQQYSYNNAAPAQTTPVAQTQTYVAMAPESMQTAPVAPTSNNEIVRKSIDPNAVNEEVSIAPQQSLAPASVGATFVVEDEFTP